MDDAGFLSAWDLNQAIARLALSRPDRMTVRSIGKSAMGRDILCLTVGGGERSALLLSGLMPDAPLGAVTLLRLVRILLLHRDLGEQARYTFHIVPCADPDGAYLNEDWLSGSLDLYHYARRCYRPVRRQTLLTEHLTRLMDDTQPDLLCILRNAVFEGPPFATASNDLLAYANGNGRPCAGLEIDTPLFPDADGALLKTILLGARDEMRAFVRLQLRAIGGQFLPGDPYAKALDGWLDSPLCALYAPAHLLSAIQQAFDTPSLLRPKALETAYALTDARLRMLCDAVDAAEYERPRVAELRDAQLKRVLEVMAG